MMRIEHLYNTPQHIRMVADWIYNEFWTENENMKPEILEGWLRDAVDPDKIPLSFLAFYDGKPAGTVNLIENDNEHRPDLAPWLAALLVRPEFRHKGIGSELVRECLNAAKRLGYKRLYLGTDIPEFYEPLGIKIHERVRDDYIIMVAELDS